MKLLIGCWVSAFVLIIRSHPTWRISVSTMIPRVIRLFVCYLMMKLGLGSDHESKVLLLGLPRTGSNAIVHFFQCQGLDARHYCCDNDRARFPCREGTIGEVIHTNSVEGNADLMDRCASSARVVGGMEVEAQEPFAWFLPQHFALPLLHDAYPDAVWILNQRPDARTWASSARHWYSFTVRMLQSFGKAYYWDDPQVTEAPLEDIEDANVVYRSLEESFRRAHNETDHERRRDELAEIYTQHLQTVSQAAEEYHHKLIKIIVDDQDGVLEALEQAFGLEHRPECWTFDARKLDHDWQDFSLKT